MLPLQKHLFHYFLNGGLNSFNSPIENIEQEVLEKVRQNPDETKEKMGREL